MKEDCSCNQQINVIMPKNEFNFEFIYYLLSFNAKRFKLIVGNTATPVLNKKTFENLEYDFPSIKEQEKISSTLSVVDKKLDFIENQLSHMEQFKKGLLQQMFV